MMVLLGACATVTRWTSPDAWQAEWTWFESQPHPALVDGAWLRRRETSNLSPAVVQEFIGASGRGDFARKFRDVQPLLRHPRDEAAALALLDLAQRAEVDAPMWTSIRDSVPLAFSDDWPDSQSCCEHYRPSDAQRWGTPRGPDVRVLEDRVEVRRPVWRRLRRGEMPEAGDTQGELALALLPGRVEYVVDTVYPDGTIVRNVERTLETGTRARLYGPAPDM